jgi:murein DD-endopeptidase MepM/ murein hydrolase activator NlpD
VDPHPITGQYGDASGRNHRGIDIGVKNLPVKAVADGTVLSTGYTDLRGHYVYIDHGGGTQSVYEHLKEMHVAQGDSVARGQVIAISGNSGVPAEMESYPYHLHFELLVDVDTAAWLAHKKKGDGTCEPPYTWKRRADGSYVEGQLDYSFLQSGRHVNPLQYLGN